MESKEQYFSVIKPTTKGSIDFSELWQFRELFYFFAWRDIKVKYKQTALGFIWVVLQPLFMVFIFNLTLGRLAGAQLTTSISYPVFAFSGLVLFNLFSTGVTNAGNSMVTNASIIKKIYFPRLIIPTSSVIGSAFDFLMSFIIFIIFLFAYHTPVDLLQLIYCWPLAIVITLVCTFGAGCWLAALTIKYRDFRYLIPFIMQALFWLSPVIYPLSVLPGKYTKIIASFNPMYAAITLFRMPLQNTAEDPTLLLISIASSLILLFVGLQYFKRTETYFADIA